MAQCPHCYGNRRCTNCGGSGHLANGLPCTSCAANGYCFLCKGFGTIGEYETLSTLESKMREELKQDIAAKPNIFKSSPREIEELANNAKEIQKINESSSEFRRDQGHSIDTKLGHLKTDSSSSSSSSGGFGGLNDFGGFGDLGGLGDFGGFDSGI